MSRQAEARSPSGPTPGREPLVLLLAGSIFLAVSAIHPHDYFTWFLEICPILAAVPLLLITYRTFPLTPVVYRFILLHAIILMVGGHYTYAEVPLGFWMQETFGFARNHYDRIGHFAQGFVPALIAREVFLRKSPLRRGGWLFYLVTSACLALSAFYELFEWWTALATGEAATAFLGTQGDPWDTQWDMCFALIGAITAQITLSRVQDRQMERIEARR